jgi:4,5-DOPA dioxygenase extradiol
MTMPILFIGHGAPMNATRDNGFTTALKRLGAALPRPTAILSISAHWETDGTMILKHPAPPKINDYFGDHPELQDVAYAPPGAETAADMTQKLIPGSRVTDSWGVDHGTWSVLVHLFPAADVPVYQMSLDRNLSGEAHYALGRRLRPLRDAGILIIGSGNICHNARAISSDQHAAPHAWNVDFDRVIADAIARRDDRTIIDHHSVFPTLAPQAVPTPEHFVPLLYALGAATDQDAPRTIFAGFEHAAMSLRSIAWQPLG